MSGEQRLVLILAVLVLGTLLGIAYFASQDLKDIHPVCAMPLPYP